MSDGLRTWIRGKIHGVRVTDASVDYHGSVSVDGDLLEAAGISPYEQVDVVNLENGNRWTTYVIPAAAGAFELNGGGAHLGAVGDRCVVMAYSLGTSFPGARVVYCGAGNSVADRFSYLPAEPVASR